MILLVPSTRALAQAVMVSPRNQDLGWKQLDRVMIFLPIIFLTPILTEANLP
jgi:hypothetical protein